MSNQTKITSASQLNTVIFKEHASKALGSRLFTLFPGLGYAAVYKIMQRVYKYGGQPFANEFLTKNFKDSYDALFGPKTGKALLSATAGSLI
ncbi:hypothetical protein DNF23_56490, partial [Pseudomonas syringae pv. pisi]